MISEQSFKQCDLKKKNDEKLSLITPAVIRVLVKHLETLNMIWVMSFFAKVLAQKVKKLYKFVHLMFTYFVRSLLNIRRSKLQKRIKIENVIL